jgi:hypothetical protein
MKATPFLFFPVAIISAASTTSIAQSSAPMIRLLTQTLPSASAQDPLGSRSLTAVQLDFTGTREILHLAGSTLEIYFNPRRGAQPSSTARYSVDANPRGLAIGDFDGDGNRDLAVLGWNSRRIQFLYGDGRGGFPRRSTLATPMQPDALVSADFDGDDRPDLAYAYAVDETRSAVRRLLNRGSGRFERTDIHVTRFVQAMLPADLDGDGSADLAIAHFEDTVTVLTNNGGGGWASSTTHRVRTRPVHLAAADLDGDGVSDLVAANFDSSNVAVLMGTGSASLAPARYYPMERSFTGRLTPTRMALGDLTGDGDIDVVLANGSLLAGRGDGSFAPPLQFDFSAGTIALHDADGDGRLDILYDHDFISTPRVAVALTRTFSVNRPPVPPPLALAIDVPFGEDAFLDARWASDPDGHLVTYEWRDELGRVVDRRPTAVARRMPGRYTYSLRLRDSWGAEVVLHPNVTVTGTAPLRTEIVLHAERATTIGGEWQRVVDPSAAGGFKLRHRDGDAARPAAARANPINYFELRFRANPQRLYTLSIRSRADGNSWRNDSVFVQFSGARDFFGDPRWRIGTSDALVYSLERCVGCGMSGWGWNFDGIPNQTNIGELIAFANDQWQTIRIQTREDGLSIDQIVLSSWTYQGDRSPGSDRQDRIVLPRTQ